MQLLNEARNTRQKEEIVPSDLKRAIARRGALLQEDSNAMTAVDTPQGNPLSTQTNAYDFIYHAEQIVKGVLVSVVGFAGYFGLRYVFGGSGEANAPKTEGGVGTLALPQENLLNMQTTISGLPTALDPQASAEFLPSASTARTLLSLQEKEGEKANVKFTHRSLEVEKADNTVHITKSTRRAALEIGYRGGNEFQVSTYTASYQVQPSVAHLNEGGFVVVWISEGQDGSSTGIYGQRYNATGFPVGGEFQVNTYTTSAQDYPAVAAFPTGGFVVVWHSDGQDGSSTGIYGQSYNTTGQPAGAEFRVNTYTTGTQSYSAVTAFPSGGFVVVWESLNQDGDSYGIYGQRYNALGLPAGAEFQVNTYTTSFQRFPVVAAFPVGDFVVVWVSGSQDGSGYGVYGQRYSALGLPAGAEFQVNTYTTLDQRFPAVTAFPAGGFVVVWASNGQDGGGYGVYGQRYNATGQPRGSEFQVNSYAPWDQRGPTVTALANDDFVVVWHSLNQDGSNWGVYGQRFAMTGQRVGPEFQVNTYTVLSQQFPAMTALTEGGFVVVWESVDQDGDSLGVYGRIFSPHTSPTLLKNTLVITQGGSVPITPAMLLAIDQETSNATLLFTVRNITFARFEAVGTPGFAITRFIQQAITDAQILFVHDGSANAPYYEMKVSDGSLESAFMLANITFYLKGTGPNPPNLSWLVPVLLTSGLLGGACLCISAAGVFVITAGGIYFAKIKNDQHHSRKSSIMLDLLGDSTAELVLSDTMQDNIVPFSELEVKSKIKSGGEAAVFLVEYKGRQMAYKLWHEGINDKAVRSFEKEANTVLNLSHPSIIQVFSICVRGKQPGILMEYMAIGSLEDYIADADKRKLTWPEKYNLILDLASAIEYLHKAGIAHRDIKSANFLLHETPELHGKLADFGLSKLKGDKSKATLMTGTLQYMAPELADGKATIDPKKTDIYSFAQTCIEIIKEKEVYKDRQVGFWTPTAVSNQGLREPLTPEMCPEALVMLLERCRSQQAKSRPGISEVIKQLTLMKNDIVNYIPSSGEERGKTSGLGLSSSM